MYAISQPYVEPTSDDALADLFRDHYPQVVRLAYVLTSDRAIAEELAQEAFVRTWRAWGRIRDHAAAPTYVRTAVVNLARSNLRRRMLELKHRTNRAEVVSDPDAGARIDVLEALRQLPPRQRACVALRYYEDLSEEETARILGVAKGTVKSQTHKALKRLEELLGGER